jgi:glycosyltransferase involved in cell wall biosynthesis
MEYGFDLHERNIAATVGAPFEYLRMDNHSSPRGICAVYNDGVRKARGDILVFVHEDVFFMEKGWGLRLEEKFHNNPDVGLVGVAGTQYLYADKMSWPAAGQPFLRGRVVHELDNSKHFIMTAFSLDKEDAEVVAVDGLFFAIRKTLFNHIRFDEETFDRFHFYDLDICMQVHKHAKLMVTWDILLKHCSAGNPDHIWREAGRRFLEKYRTELPVTCTSMVPDPGVKPEYGINIDLRGKASTNTIC